MIDRRDHYNNSHYTRNNKYVSNSRTSIHCNVLLSGKLYNNTDGYKSHSRAQTCTAGWAEPMIIEILEKLEINFTHFNLPAIHRPLVKAKI